MKSTLLPLIIPFEGEEYHVIFEVTRDEQGDVVKFVPWAGTFDSAEHAQRFCDAMNGTWKSEATQ